MRNFIRRQTLYFLVGFVLTFIVYLFVRFDVDAVILGVTIAAVGGAATSIALFYLGRKFSAEEKAVTGSTSGKA